MNEGNELIGVAPGAVTVLCAVNGKVQDGDVRLEVSHTQLRWYGPGSVRWEFDVTAAGEYSVAICCACRSDGIDYELSCGDAKVSGRLPVTHGYFKQSETPINYERIATAAVFSLAAGTREISLSVPRGAVAPRLAVSSLELVPAAAAEAIAAEAERAAESRPSADWFAHAGYGLMFHWTSKSYPRRGPLRPYREAVEAFDVDELADIAAEAGAGYVMFTANHAEPSFPGPVHSWEAMYPGWSTERDLVAELATALSRRRVRLFLYLNPFAAYIRSGRVRNVDGSTEFNNGVRMRGDCREDYLGTTCELLTEIGTRYRTDLAGYWFDSWYQPFMHFGHFPMEPVYRAAKAGNSDRLCAFNWWILPNGTPWQDYWAGESGGIGADPEERYPDYGPGRGLQRHALLIMDDPWVHEKPNTPVAPPALETDELVRFVRRNHEFGGVVTVNLGIYQDGGVASESLAVMRAVQKAVRS